VQQHLGCQHDGFGIDVKHDTVVARVSTSRGKKKIVFANVSCSSFSFNNIQDIAMFGAAMAFNTGLKTLWFV
jgi:hypothetical protein